MGSDRMTPAAAGAGRRGHRAWPSGWWWSWRSPPSPSSRTAMGRVRTRAPTGRCPWPRRTRRARSATRAPTCTRPRSWRRWRPSGCCPGRSSWRVWTTLLLLVLRWMSRPAAVRAAHRAHVPGAVGRQHHHPAGGDDRGRLPPPGRLGVRAADQGHARPGPAVVRGPPRVAGAGGGRRRDARSSWPSRCSSRPQLWRRVARAARQQHRLQHGARVGAHPARWCGCRSRPWSSSGPRSGTGAGRCPSGVLLAMPVIWWGSFAILAACVALERGRIEARLFGIAATRIPGSPRLTRGTGGAARVMRSSRSEVVGAPTRGRVRWP